MNQFTKIIAAQLKLREQAVENTLELLEEGCTIPFISRYRKEKTGNMDEVNIEAIAQANEKLKEMAKRKETILKTIEEQGKLTDELKEKILAAKRAGIKHIVMCRENQKNVEEIPEKYLKGVDFHYVENVADVWQFALTDEKVKNPTDFSIQKNDKKE